MGWGEVREPSPELVLDAADKLADALWGWNEHRSCNNEDKVLEALRRYEKLRNRPSKGFLGC